MTDEIKNSVVNRLTIPTGELSASGGADVSGSISEHLSNLVTPEMLEQLGSVFRPRIIETADHRLTLAPLTAAFPTATRPAEMLLRETNGAAPQLEHRETGLSGPHYLSDCLISAGPLAGNDLGELGIIAGGTALEPIAACVCAWQLFQPRWERVDGVDNEEKDVSPAADPPNKDATREYSVPLEHFILAEFQLTKGPAAEQEYSIDASFVGGDEAVLLFPVTGAVPEKPANLSAAKRPQKDKLACPGTVRVLIYGKKIGRVTVVGKWGVLECKFNLNVFDPETAVVSSAYEGKDKKQADADDEAREKAEAKDGPPPPEKVCVAKCSRVDAYWNNHPWKDPNGKRELDDKYNKGDPPRTSWHASWPGYPQWHAIVDIKPTQKAEGWINWKCEVDVEGSLIGADGQLKAGMKDIWQKIKDDKAYRKAWEAWLTMLLSKPGEPADPAEVARRLEELEAGDDGKRKEAAKPNNLGDFPDGLKIVVASGKLPCRNQRHHFVFRIPPMPASQTADGKPTVHSTFYQCKLFVNDGKEPCVDSGVKMRVVEYDDVRKPDASKKTR